MTLQALKTTDLMHMSQAELDELYKNSSIGTIPEGNGKGTVITIGGFGLGPVLSLLIRLIAWQGKVFYGDRESLLNKLTPFRIRLVKAEVYKGESWLCDGESIILDYSKTSFVAQKIRDEIREVAPGIYLGNAYWGKTRLLNFILEF
ncbi:hypothetical protein WA1_24275 [Scytonema hofmannii PCC 7110]|uniref:Uncharacterized protein n=1 Tax=Scytonema hofmannii PCC 7110 TaxID=128403 RepID=A0A139X7V2_9CYAN|nr:hypothetical protein [Scytonema hofmannii]KYC40756.1 hypothetical protein WA1_24275 [Scytonema hofmannii PCC 7110]